MRLYWSIAVLLVLAVSASFLLTHLTRRVAPRLAAWTQRLLVLVLAHAMRAACGLLRWLAKRASLRIARHRESELNGLVALYWRLLDMAAAVSPNRFHVTAVALHRVCTPCAEDANERAGWWDFEVDCAGHACGTCEECRGEWTNFGIMTAPEPSTLA